jgi:Na+-transporting methylmalonyl-CoA/oxaloacetate decarboxylase gamma subunit
MQKVLEVINNLNNVFMRKLGLIMAVLLMGTFVNAQDGKIVDPVKKEIKKDTKKAEKNEVSF